MAYESALLEIGNTSAKLVPAGKRPEGSSILRFDDVEPLLDRLALIGGKVLCVPTGSRMSRQILDRVPSTVRARVLEWDDFLDFIGETYDTPETLGLDRILNLIGLEGDGIVVSCGTAITVDAVARGRPFWGAILSGFTTASEGLHNRIPALPSIDISTNTPALPARSSKASVANGVLLGTALGAQGIVRAIARQLFVDIHPRIVLTGGDAELMLSLWEGDERPVIDEALLFKGMKDIE